MGNSKLYGGGKRQMLLAGELVIEGLESQFVLFLVICDKATESPLLKRKEAFPEWDESGLFDFCVV